MSASRLIIPVMGCRGAGSTSFLQRLSQPDWKLDEKKYAMTLASASITCDLKEKEITFRDIPMSAMHLQEVQDEIKSNAIKVMVIDLSGILNDQTQRFLLFRNLAKNQGIYIVGTKLDEAKITLEELDKFTTENGFTYLGSCSAKTGQGIEECKAALSSVMRSMPALATSWQMPAIVNASGPMPAPNNGNHPSNRNRIVDGVAEAADTVQRDYTTFIYGAFFGGVVQTAFTAATITAQQTVAQAATLLFLNFAVGFGITLVAELIAFMLVFPCLYYCCLSSNNDASALSP